MNTYEFEGKKPKIAKNTFIAPNAQLIGDVEIADGSSVWYGAVIRADLGPIRIGKNVSIQDNCVLHVSKSKPLIIGDNVAVGHGAILHSTQIAGDCIIGMESVLLTGSKVGKNCIIGAGSVVTEGTEIPDHSIVMGIPGKPVKKTTPEHTDRIKRNVQEYIDLCKRYSQK